MTTTTPTTALITGVNKGLGRETARLVNNAGIIGGAGTLETGPADFLACFGVNLLGPVRVTRAALPLLARSEHPRIVMVSSGLGSMTVTNDPDRLESTLVTMVYPASKAALNMVTTQYAKARPGFRINAVDPATRPPTSTGTGVTAASTRGPPSSWPWPRSRPTAPPAASSTMPAPCPGDRPLGTAVALVRSVRGEHGAPPVATMPVALAPAARSPRPVTPAGHAL